MRYKLNPETIDPNKIAEVRRELETSMGREGLNRWLRDFHPRVRSEILDVVAQSAVETASMLEIPIAWFHVTAKRALRNGWAAEANAMTMQERPTRDRIAFALWYIEELADQIRPWTVTARRKAALNLGGVIAHEQYHLKEARTTPERYERSVGKMTRAGWETNRSEKAANLFEKYYKYLKKKQLKR